MTHPKLRSERIERQSVDANETGSHLNWIVEIGSHLPKEKRVSITPFQWYIVQVQSNPIIIRVSQNSTKKGNSTNE